MCGVFVYESFIISLCLLVHVRAIRWSFPKLVMGASRAEFRALPFLSFIFDPYSSSPYFIGICFYCCFPRAKAQQHEFDKF